MSPPPLPPAPAHTVVRLVMVGDVVGKPGMRMVCDSIAWLRASLRAHGVVVNAENAADGSGLRCTQYRRLVEHGVDAITLGDHVFRKREIMDPLASESNIVRPANLPATAPGRGAACVTLDDGTQIAVISLLGRVFMNPVDCPFLALDRELAQLPQHVRVRLVDFHAEATSDMQLMGRYADGRASAVLGTHTHVATADEQIFPGGTGFQCDVGMTGPFESILGRRIDAVQQATVHSLPTPFQVAKDDVRLNGTWVDVDRQSGQCKAIGRIQLTENELAAFLKERAPTGRVL